jgi:fimbrial chaperone protein
MDTLTSPALRLFRAAALAALTLWVGAARAQSVSPVLVELSPQRRVNSVTVTNGSDRAMSFQVEVRAWSQVDGRDVYEPSADLLVAPAVADIGPGRSQIFRITSRIPPAPVEKAYRLILENVTESQAPTSGSGVGVQLNFSHDLPVFVAPAGRPSGHLRVGPCPAQPGGNCIRLHNDGDRRVKVISLVVEGEGWSRTIASPPTILPGSWWQWPIEPPVPGRGPLLVKASTSDGPLTLTLR